MSLSSCLYLFRCDLFKCDLFRCALLRCDLFRCGRLFNIDFRCCSICNICWSIVVRLLFKCCLRALCLHTFHCCSAFRQGILVFMYISMDSLERKPRIVYSFRPVQVIRGHTSTAEYQSSSFHISNTSSGAIKFQTVSSVHTITLVPSFRPTFIQT